MSNYVDQTRKAIAGGKRKRLEEMVKAVVSGSNLCHPDTAIKHAKKLINAIDKEIECDQS